MIDRNRIPHLSRGARHPDWQLLYQRVEEDKLPWHFEEADPDIDAEIRDLPKSTVVLDIGTGLGNQAMWISRRGFAVTATDISEAAVTRARGKYPEVSFVVDDIVQTNLSGKFDVIVDRGCLHVIDPNDHVNYLTNVQNLLSDDGIFLTKLFNSEMGPADFGPYRFSLKGIHKILGSAFQIIRIHRTLYHGSTDNPPLAWFVVMRKRKAK